MNRLIALLVGAALAIPCVFARPAFATLYDTSNGRVAYTGNGATLAYPFTFPVANKTEVQALINSVVQVGSFSVVINSDQISAPGGTVTFLVAPPNSAAIVLQRVKKPYTQQTIYNPYNPFPAKVTERAFDSAIQIAQENARDIADLQVKETADFLSVVNPTGTTLASNTQVTATGASASQTLANQFAQLGANVMNFGCFGDGINDDTACVQRAANAAAGGVLRFPYTSGSYKITGTITISNSMLIVGPGKIYMAFTSALPVGGILFDVTASDVEFNHVWIDSTGTANSPIATINHYAIRFHGTSGTHLKNIKVRNCSFTNLPWNDTYGAVVTTHAVYVQWADNVTVQDSRFEAPAGAATFFSGVTNGYVLNNRINDTGWYSVQFNDLVSNSRISGNTITGTTNGVRVWGGSINLMSNDSTGTACGTQGCARINNVEVDHNYISGVHSYTGAVHIESCSHIKFHDNIMEKITLTLSSPFYADGSPAVYIRPYVRPTNVPPTGNEGPNDHIEITNNLLIAGSVGAIAVYADAQDNGSGALAYSDGLLVAGNQIQSLDTAHYFSNGISVHGQQGGWKDVSIVNNDVSGFPDTTSPNLGMIGTQGLVAAPVLDVLIANNQVSVVGGTPSSTSQLGIGIGAYTQNVRVGGNKVRGFWTGIRTFTNSSSILVGPPNLFVGSLNANYLAQVAFLNRATITLAAGTGTATVLADSQCTCTDTTANASVKCAISAGTFPAGTATLTATGTGTDVIAFNCN
jgi:hypothetical protein